jgi:hypothetical protein
MTPPSVQLANAAADRDIPYAGIGTAARGNPGWFPVGFPGSLRYQSVQSLAGGTVIRKQPLGADAPRRLRHELGLLSRLRGVSGVAQLLAAPTYPDSIVLADVGGISLAGLPTPLNGAELIELAVRLARAVAVTTRAAADQTSTTSRLADFAIEGRPDRSARVSPTEASDITATR